MGSREARQLEVAATLIRDADGRVLLIHEAYGFQRFGLPGGRIEAGERPADAAVRETSEETGLTVTLGELLFAGDFVGADGIPFRAYAFDVVEAHGAPAVQDPTEITSVGWYDLDDLPEPLTLLTAELLPRLRGGEARRSR